MADMTYDEGDDSGILMTEEIIKPGGPKGYRIVWREKQVIGIHDENDVLVENERWADCCMVCTDYYKAMMHLRFLWSVGLDAQMFSDDELVLPMMSNKTRCWNMRYENAA